VFLIGKKHLEQAVIAYADAILLRTSDPKVVAECHKAKLALTHDGEVRIRAIQMLALLKHGVLVAPLMKELTSVSGTWPAAGANHRAHVLFRLLLDYMSQNPSVPGDE
jgi:hypothetical protein